MNVVIVGAASEMSRDERGWYWKLGQKRRPQGISAIKIRKIPMSDEGGIGVYWNQDSIDGANWLRSSG